MDRKYRPRRATSREGMSEAESPEAGTSKGWFFFTSRKTFASKSRKTNNVQEKSDGRSSPKSMRTPEMHLPCFRRPTILQSGLLGRRRERQHEQQLRLLGCPVCLR